MVCEKCEKKLKRVIVPDKWKDGARNTDKGARVGSSGAVRKERSRLKKFSPMDHTCRICKSKLQDEKSHYCQPCAYQKGICKMCGRKLVDTKSYNMSST